MDRDNFLKMYLILILLYSYCSNTAGGSHLRYHRLKREKWVFFKCLRVIYVILHNFAKEYRTFCVQVANIEILH